jgi:hypothetical protein
MIINSFNFVIQLIHLLVYLFYYSVRALLCRPLPVDVGRCTCIIAKETVEGPRGVSVYSLYTNVSFWCILCLGSRYP